MIKFEKGQWVLLVGCLGLLCLTAVCFLLPWVPFYRMLHYPDSSHAQAKPPETQLTPQSKGLEPAVDIHSKSQNVPLLPPSLKRMQDLEGSEASSQIMRKIEALKNAEINLAGIVIDESGAALQDVEVTWSLGYVPSHQKNSGSVKTSAAGEFFIADLISPTIHLTPYKTGYSVREESTGTWFADVPCSKVSPLKLIMTKD